MTKEIYGGRYEVSDDGKIYTNVKYKQRRELIGKVGSSGYRMVVLTVDGKKLYKNVHRLIAESFLDNLEGKREVNHIDGDKLNNAVSNLEWVTTRENQLHVRDVLGSKKLKLSVEKANEIRSIYAEGGITQRALAKRYGVKKSIIGQIISNKRWKTTQHNFPDTIQLGDAFQVRDDGWKIEGVAPEEELIRELAQRMVQGLANIVHADRLQTKGNPLDEF